MFLLVILQYAKILLFCYHCGLSDDDDDDESGDTVLNHKISVTF